MNVHQILSPWLHTYRERVHEIVDKNPYFDYTVVYCQKIESNRSWKFDYGEYNKIFLNSSKVVLGKKTIYLGAGIIRHLLEKKPEVVVTAGFNVPMLIGFLYAKLFGKKHIAYTDAWPGSEINRKQYHRLLRKIVYPLSDAFIGVSDKSFSLFKQYTKKAKANKYFFSYLCADNESFYSGSEKKYDLLYCGQFIERKLPFFMFEVVKAVRKKIPNIKVLLIGDGILYKDTIASFEKENIDYCSPGFVQPKMLPEYFSKCKVFLFPTKVDAWGLVANEACAASMPVITTPYAGVKNELVIDNFNGYILKPDIQNWANQIIRLLSDDDLYREFSKNARASSLKYNYQDAADGFIAAVRSVL